MSYENRMGSQEPTDAFHFGYNSVGSGDPGFTNSGPESFNMGNFMAGLSSSCNNPSDKKLLLLCDIQIDLLTRAIKRAEQMKAIICQKHSGAGQAGTTECAELPDQRF
ncbi:unnamed protein product [Clonostachys rosea f. rosea IK726]|uniref:Uncharacterized protein n=2 Tax=Bionectria ochroleuca TaxID=29856 RepID=A0A0B7KMU3_BIOOC|nr:unnamed protein product [Clonostachys rosea f. rosea IK726]